VVVVSTGTVAVVVVGSSTGTVTVVEAVPDWNNSGCGRVVVVSTGSRGRGSRPRLEQWLWSLSRGTVAVVEVNWNSGRGCCLEWNSGCGCLGLEQWLWSLSPDWNSGPGRQSQPKRYRNA